MPRHSLMPGRPSSRRAGSGFLGVRRRRLRLLGLGYWRGWVVRGAHLALLPGDSGCVEWAVAGGVRGTAGCEWGNAGFSFAGGRKARPGQASLLWPPEVGGQGPCVEGRGGVAWH